MKFFSGFDAGEKVLHEDTSKCYQNANKKILIHGYTKLYKLCVKIVTGKSNLCFLPRLSKSTQSAFTVSSDICIAL